MIPCGVLYFIVFLNISRLSMRFFSTFTTSLCLSVIQSVQSELLTYYIWHKEKFGSVKEFGDSGAFFHHELPDREHGFIILRSSARKGGLETVQMRRPGDRSLWASGSGEFCETTLPVAIKAFAARLGADSVKELYVDVESAYMQADCECYVKTMRSLGFASIMRASGQLLAPDASAHEFCNWERDYILTGRVAPGSASQLGLEFEDAEGLAILGRADVLSKDDTEIDAGHSVQSHIQAV